MLPDADDAGVLLATERHIAQRLDILHIHALGRSLALEWPPIFTSSFELWQSRKSNRRMEGASTALSSHPLSQLVPPSDRNLFEFAALRVDRPEVNPIKMISNSLSCREVPVQRSSAFR